MMSARGVSDVLVVTRLASLVELDTACIPSLA